MNRLFRILLAVLVTCAPVLAVASPVSAASASLSLSPGSSSVSKGSVLTISVYVNAGEAVNAAKANLSYPADKFDFVSIGSSSAFGIVAANSGGGGNVTIDRGALPAVSGNQLVATVRLRAKVDSGTAAVSFAGGSSVIAASSNSNILSGTTGGNYTLRAPAAAPAAAPPPAADKIAPTLKDIKVADITHNTATVTWTSSEPATSQVDYGLNNGYGLTAGDNNPKTNHKLVLNSALLTPGTKYHFVVKSVDPAGNAVTSENQTFTTKGATLSVIILDQNKKPVKGARVELGNGSGVTDKQGRVILTDLQLGKTVGKVTHEGKEQVVTVTVNPLNTKGTPQAVTLTIQKSDSNLLFLILPLIALLLLALLLKRKNAFKDLSKYLPNMKPGRGSNGPKPPTPVSPGATSSSRVEPSVIKPTIPPRIQK